MYIYDLIIYTSIMYLNPPHFCHPPRLPRTVNTASAPVGRSSARPGSPNTPTRPRSPRNWHRMKS